MNSIKIAACQPFYIDNDLEKSLELIISYSKMAEEEDADLLCFPECFLQGYTVSEKTREMAIDLSSEEFETFLEKLKDIQPILIIGLIEKSKEDIFNTAVVLQKGKLLGKYRKNNLVGRENEVFCKGSDVPVFDLRKNYKFGINICYDTNFPKSAKAVADQGAQLLVCLSNNMLSRLSAEKWKEKHNPIRAERCIEAGLWMLSSDVTGEFEDKISYGPTAVINPRGSVVKQLPLMSEGLLVYELE